MSSSTETLDALLQKESTTYAMQDYLRISGADEESSNILPDSASFCPNNVEGSGFYPAEDDSSCCQQAKKRKLRGANPACRATPLTEDQLRRQLWREKLCEWAYQVVDHFGLSRENVSIAMNSFDRHCAVIVQGRRSASIEKNTAFLPLSKDEVALTAMTCLALAIKLNEYRRILVPGAKSTMETILMLGRGSFSMEQLRAKEYDVLNSLQWMVHPPTPQLFLHYLFVEFASLPHPPAHGEVRDLALYLIEMSVLDYSFVSYKASEVALASTLNAMDTCMTNSPPVSSVDFSFLGQLRVHRTPRVISCQKRLATLYSKCVESESTSAPSSGMARMSSPVSVTADFLG